MNDSQLDCKIYVETDQSLDDLTTLMSSEAAARGVSKGPSSRVLRSDFGEIEIRKSDDSDPARVAEFPDGFLFFNSIAEFYLHSELSTELRTSVIASILNRLWLQGIPAVAACDFEDDLPKKGGYQDSSIPWPSSRSRQPLPGVQAPSSLAGEVREPL